MKLTKFLSKYGAMGATGSCTEHYRFCLENGLSASESLFFRCAIGARQRWLLSRLACTLRIQRSRILPPDPRSIQTEVADRGVSWKSHVSTTWYCGIYSTISCCIWAKLSGSPGTLARVLKAFPFLLWHTPFLFYDLQYLCARTKPPHCSLSPREVCTIIC